MLKKKILHVWFSGNLFMKPHRYEQDMNNFYEQMQHVCFPTSCLVADSTYKYVYLHVSQLSNDSSYFLIINSNILPIFVQLPENQACHGGTSQKKSYINVHNHMKRKHTHSEGKHLQHLHITSSLPLTDQRYLKTHCYTVI